MNNHDKWQDELEVWRMNSIHLSIMQDWYALIADMDEFPEETDKVVNDILARMRR